MIKSIGFGFKTALGISGILLGLAAGSAMATTVTTSSVSLPNGSTTVNINDTLSGQSSIDQGGQNLITGTIGLQTNLGVLNTYCVDLFDYINLGSTVATFNQNALAAGETFQAGSGNGTFTQAQVTRLTALLTNGALQAQNTVNTAALQIAIWEIEYDTPSGGVYNLTNPDSFYITHTSDSNSTAALNQAQVYLNDVTNSTWSTDSTHFVEFLTSTTGSVQDLIYLANGTVATPEPSTVAVFGIGLVGLWAARRRKMI
jgi:PEP-CTERM motif